MSDIIRTVRRFGEYYTRAEPFHEADPKGWECRVIAGNRIKAQISSPQQEPRPVVVASALPCANGDGGKAGNVLTLRRKRHG